jgi:hypothetical protein
MEQEIADFYVLERLLVLSRLERTPTADEEKEHCQLQDELKCRLANSISLEGRTTRLVRYLKAA